jgi:hypothetical protein
VAGTTVRHALGYQPIPRYDSATHIFSDELLRVFPGAAYDDFELYLDYVDHVKQTIYKRQVRQGDDSVSFTFVRYPVQRFLSGLEQIERHDDNDWEVSEDARACFDQYADDSHGKVNCVVDSLLTTRLFFNVHLYPQAYLFDSWTKQGAFDTAITVLNLKDVDALLKRFTGEAVPRARESSTQDKLNLQASDLHHDLLAKICRLYHIDLLLLQELGMKDPLCPPANQQLETV